VRSIDVFAAHLLVAIVSEFVGNKGSDMRILIQQKDSGLYFRDVGDWTRSPAEAMDFLSSTSAIDFCVLNKISHVQLVLKFEEQQYDIVLPVLTKTSPRDESRKPL
jgi:hypothetical protein